MQRYWYGACREASDSQEATMSDNTNRPGPDAELPVDPDAQRNEGIPGVFGDVPVDDSRDAIDGPAGDATLGSNATGADNLAGGTRTPPSGGGTSGFGG
jgi:hypothetical protein